MCVCCFANLQEDASYTTEQLHSLVGFILDDGVIGLHSQNIVLMERERKERNEERNTKRKEISIK